MKQYLRDNRFKLCAAAILGCLAAFGALDASAALGGLLLIGDIEPASLKELNAAMKAAFDSMKSKIEQNAEVIEKAKKDLSEVNTIKADTADKLKQFGEAATEAAKKAAESEQKFNSRLLEVEQKMAAGHGRPGSERQKSIGEIFAESDQLKSFLKAKGKHSDAVEIPAAAVRQAKAAILNVSTLDGNQPLVAPDRVPGIIAPATRRLTIRDLLPQIPTSSDVVQFARELVATSGAGPQGGGSSPIETEGQLKGESAITFELVNSVVITLAHWIPASRQILSDAQALAGYINTRMAYLLKLEEEDELLNADGTAGKLSGLRHNATAFTGGSTNETLLDVILTAFTQVELAYFEATGIILHPSDWLKIRTAKDSQGRYLFSDPHSQETPRVWGKNVVATATMTQGKFLTGAFDLSAAIYDREGLTLRASEEHSDFFVRNLVAILCEERVALAVYRPAGLVTGDLSYAG